MSLSDQTISPLRPRSEASNQQSAISNLKRGFSLIELLTVIAIIGILVTMVTASFFKAQQKARDAKRKTDLKAIQQALELYFQSNGKYPAYGGWCTQISNPSFPEVKNALVPTFIGKLPEDPTSPGGPNDYFYSGIAGVYTYSLYSTLENTNDQEYIANALSADGLLGCAGGNSNYHYKVINP